MSETLGDSAVHEELLSRSVDTLELSVRSANCLAMAGIKTIGELVAKTQAQLLLTRNLGLKSLKELRRATEELGLEIGKPRFYCPPDERASLLAPTPLAPAPQSVANQNRRLQGYIRRALRALEQHDAYHDDCRPKLAARKWEQAMRELRNGVSDVQGFRR